MEEVLLEIRKETDFVSKTRFDSLMERFKKLIKNLSFYYERGNLENVLVILNQLIRDLAEFKHSENLSSNFLVETDHQLLILGLLRASLIDVIEKNPQGIENFSTILKMINYSRYNITKPEIQGFK
ncbi:hypothetical protein FO519_008624 [Halicephalobus sp. NKZ332]|nr:hypothetical protein FO519_008624 [Halicephalobus sp. NKZ332]